MHHAIQRKLPCLQESSENENGEIVKNFEQREVHGIKFKEVVDQFVSANPRRKSPMFEAIKGM